MIELIAVIVILGILAAAAVPRFLDARDDAEKAAAHGIVAAWQSTCAMNFADSILNDTEFKCPTATTGEDGAVTTSDDWSLDLGGNKFKITSPTASADYDCALVVDDKDGNELARGEFKKPTGKDESEED